MPKRKKTAKNIDRFKALAHELNCDQSEASFDARLGRVGRSAPVPKPKPRPIRRKPLLVFDDV